VAKKLKAESLCRSNLTYVAGKHPSKGKTSHPTITVTHHSLVPASPNQSNNVYFGFSTRSPTLLDRYGGRSVSISLAVPLAA